MVTCPGDQHGECNHICTIAVCLEPHRNRMGDVKILDVPRLCHSFSLASVSHLTLVSAGAFWGCQVQWWHIYCHQQQQGRQELQQASSIFYVSFSELEELVTIDCRRSQCPPYMRAWAWVWAMEIKRGCIGEEFSWMSMGNTC